MAEGGGPAHREGQQPPAKQVIQQQLCYELVTF